jgi:hypothetical protein
VVARAVFSIGLRRSQVRTVVHDFRHLTLARAWIPSPKTA